MESSQVCIHPIPKVLVLLDNLFFAGKINQAAAHTDIKLIYTKKFDQALSLARAEQPNQIIVDLDATGCEPLKFLTLLTADADLQNIPTLGFVSHVNLQLQQLARAAGCNRIATRSSLDRNLAALFSQIS
jgi:PleD family two-component response regulator